jgi:hypothetical protein
MTSARLHLSCPDLAPQGFRKSAEIARFPKSRLPDLIEDFGASSAKLIAMTFPGPSRNAVCLMAARHLGCSPDTVERILSGAVRQIDPRVMFLCLGIYQSRTGCAFPIGGGYEVRISQVGN